MVGRVWPRHGHRGRPLNSVVSRHLEAVVNEPLDILKALLHGRASFQLGMRVTVTRATEGTYLVDRGMLCTSVKIPLMPGDNLEYRGPHLAKENVVQIPQAHAGEFLSRIANSAERSWIDTSAFYLYLPIEERLEANDG
jgi:hypothetical protein